MFSHVIVGSNDLEKAKCFYDAVLGTLDVGPGRRTGERVVYATSQGMFAVTTPIDGQAATRANGGTNGFGCASGEQVEAWHAAGVAHGGATCEDPPGVRSGDFGKIHLAYLRDPDGNKLCAMYRLV